MESQQIFIPEKKDSVQHVLMIILRGNIGSKVKSCSVPFKPINILNGIYLVRKFAY